jgi:hypothetical protein
MRFSMGALGYSVYTDMSPGWQKPPFFGLLLPDVLSLQCNVSDISYVLQAITPKLLSPLNCVLPLTPFPCFSHPTIMHLILRHLSYVLALSIVRYTWRPDYASWNGTCDGAPVSLQTAYQSNSTICSRFDFGAQPAERTVSFVGAPPNSLQTIATSVAYGGDYMKTSDGGGGGGAVVTKLIMWSKNEMPMNRTRWWLLQSNDVDGKPELTAEGRSTFTARIPASGGPKTVTFCLTELEHQPPGARLPVMPAYDPTPTTEKINAWLADAAEPTALLGTVSTELQLDSNHRSGSSSTNIGGSGDRASGSASSSSSAVRMYYRSWYQFWYNTEHDAGHWIKPVVCPARGYYGGALWLWDTGFHVHGLLTSKGPLGLAKALDQLEVLILLSLRASARHRKKSTPAICTSCQTTLGLLHNPCWPSSSFLSNVISSAKHTLLPSFGATPT